MIKLEDFYEFETSTIKSKLRVKGLNIYMLLRDHIYYAYLKEKYNYSAKTRKSTKKQLANNFIYGFKQILKLKKYKYFFFTNTNKRENINDQYFDVLFDSIADKIGQDKVLFIERASTSHIKQDLVYSKNIISDLPFKLLISFISIFVFISRKEIKSTREVSLLKNHPIRIKKILKKRIAEVKFYYFLLKFAKPSSIFVLSSYSKTSLVIAAHKLRIEVVEPQHGFIGHSHFLYHNRMRVSRLYYPDYLLSFGAYEKNHGNNNLVFSPDRILPIGSYFLENIKHNYFDDYLNNLKKCYSNVFCVTLQGVKETALLDWILEAAYSHSDWLFILRPKYSKDGLNKYLKAKNIVLLEKYNIYNILKYSDYNITIYSTTAVEADYLDVTTLFYNIDSLSLKFFDKMNIDAVFFEIDQPLSVSFSTRNSSREGYFKSNYLLNLKNINFN